MVRSCKQLHVLYPPDPWHLSGTALLSGFQSSQEVWNSLNKAALSKCSFIRNEGQVYILYHCKAQWRGALMFSLICAWTNGWWFETPSRSLLRYCNAVTSCERYCVSNYGKLESVFISIETIFPGIGNPIIKYKDKTVVRQSFYIGNLYMG